MQLIQGSVQNANTKTKPESLLWSAMVAEHKKPEQKHGKYKIFYTMGNLVPLPERYDRRKLVAGQWAEQNHHTGPDK